MTEVNLNVNDAVDRAGMLQFLSDWLARDPVRFLLGGSDGESFFSPPQ